MVVTSGYMCKKCGRLYNETRCTLPIYCKRCGEDLVRKRYAYNLAERNGELVETRATNFFGGYDCEKTILTDNVEEVKLKRRFLFWWELFGRK